MSGTRVLEASVCRQLLIDHAFVSSSCTDARHHRRYAHYARRPLLLYPTLPSLPVILQSMQLPRFTSSKLYHSQAAVK